ncbi:MAG: hypothetical protein ABJC61_06430 [Acidobacteriota bacterium]
MHVILFGASRMVDPGSSASASLDAEVLLVLSIVRRRRPRKSGAR